MNKLILESNAIFKNFGFPYYVCGGFALDIFMGKTMRPHSDVDISIFHKNKRDVVAFLQTHDWDVYKRVFEPGSLGGLTPIADKSDDKLDEIWVIWAIKPGSHLVPKLRKGEADLYDFEILAHEQTSSTFIEIVLDHKESGNFLCGKDKKVVRKLDKAILYKDDIPYMAPEVVLFLKSPQVYLTHEIHKEKTPADFKAVFPLLPNESRQWFMNALDIAYPDGYGWLDDLLSIGGNGGNQNIQQQ